MTTSNIRYTGDTKPANGRRSVSILEAEGTLAATVIGMLRAFWDESGHHRGSPIFALAGYLATTERWHQFERDWKQTLGGFTPRIEKPFHMSEFAHPNIPGHQFSGWPEELRRHLLSQLLGVIHDGPPHLIAVGYAIDMKAWRGLPEEVRAELGDDPYFWGFASCVGEAAKLLDAFGVPQTEKIGFIFDRKAGFVQRATDLYNKAKADPRWGHADRLSDLIAFGSKDEFCALQAADLLAYEVFSDFDNRLSSGEHKMRYPLQEIVKHPCTISAYDEAAFERHVQRLKRLGRYPTNP